jgi:predicted transcriptional regulator
MADGNDHLAQVVAQVAAAYFSNSHVSPSDIPAVLAQITAHFAGIGAPVEAAARAEDRPTSTVATPAQIRKSVTYEALISFEDGRPYQTLRRHLTVHGLTPDEYRAKWGLPPDYPMVSAAYSAKRSELARNIGLGQIRNPKEIKPTGLAASKPVSVRKVGGRPN